MIVQRDFRENGVGASKGFRLIYDPIGNRLTHANGDDDDTSYTSNNLNQYTEICPPPLPPVCEEPTYDADGNLTGDANWNYYWDLENRLVSVHRDTNDAKGPNYTGLTILKEPKLLAFTYDALGRRVETKEYVDAATGQFSAGLPNDQAPLRTVRHVYVGLENVQDWTERTDVQTPGYYVKQQYLWGDSERFPEPIAMLTPFEAQTPEGEPPVEEKAWHYLHDVLGSVVGIVDGTTCGTISCPEFGQYSNVIDPTYGLLAGDGLRIADDLTLAGVGARWLDYLDLAVFSNGGGTFDVTVTLYDDCPFVGGSPIPGTSFNFSGVPGDNSIYTLVVDPVQPRVLIPGKVWMVVDCSRADVVWVIAGYPELGITEDRVGYNSGTPTCNAIFSGSYAGLWANVRCVQSATELREGQTSSATSRLSIHSSGRPAKGVVEVSPKEPAAGSKVIALPPGTKRAPPIIIRRGK